MTEKDYKNKNQDKLTTLDVNFLMGKIKEKDYKNKRALLRKNVSKIIRKNR